MYCELHNYDFEFIIVKILKSTVNKTMIAEYMYVLTSVIFLLESTNTYVQYR